MGRMIMDYDDGDFAVDFSGNMAVDSEGNLMMRISDNMAMEIDSGELHCTSSWGQDGENDD